jgi:PTS system nitrogen regulatory IIA component
MIDMTDLLAPDRVLVGLRPGSKRHLLQELADAAAAVSGLPAKPILDSLIQREKLGTTGVGDGLAIPHAKVPGLPKLMGFFAKLARPVEFDSLDDKPVDIVFLLLAPEDAGAEHLKALARIARILRDPALCAKLRQMPDAARAYALLTGRPESHAA